MEDTNGTITPINIDYPSAQSLHLRVRVGACRLSIKPGEQDAWVTGTYNDPSGVLPLKILGAAAHQGAPAEQSGDVTITQEGGPVDAWTRFRTTQPPTFDLVLGKSRPYELSLEGGASECSVDLGALPLRRLTVQQGAGKMEIDFSAPNPEPMAMLDVDAGAIGMALRNLANANFTEMTLDGGAAGYELDFGGVLQRDANVRISTGLSGVQLRVPATTAAKIISQSMLAGLEIGDGFTKREGAFWTVAGSEGASPLLTIRANVTLGGLTIEILA